MTVVHVALQPLLRYVPVLVEVLPRHGIHALLRTQPLHQQKTSHISRWILLMQVCRLALSQAVHQLQRFRHLAHMPCGATPVHSRCPPWTGMVQHGSCAACPRQWSQHNSCNTAWCPHFDICTVTADPANVTFLLSNSLAVALMSAGLPCGTCRRASSPCPARYMPHPPPPQLSFVSPRRGLTSK